MLLLLACVVPLILLPYLLGPLVNRFSQRISAAPRFEVFDPARHPAPASMVATVREAADSLAAAGFERVADLYQTGMVAGMTNQFTLLEKHSTGQQAMCVGMHLASDPTGAVTNYVEIMTYFADGRMLLVNNCPTLGTFADVPGRTLERLRTVRDPAHLAAIHETLLSRVRGDCSIVQRDDRLDPGEHLVRLTHRELEAQVPLGFLWFDRPANAYRPTWKGAPLMVWKLLPPWSMLRDRRVRQREAQLLAELAMTDADAPAATAPPLTARTTPQRLSIVALVVLSLGTAYMLGIRTAPAGALEPPAPASFVRADFDVPNDFPGAVRALEGLADATAGPLMVRDSLGARVKTIGASIGIRAALADSIIAGAQRRFLERGFFLFRHEPNYGLNGRPDEVALVPMWDHYRVVKLVGTNGANFGITNAQVIIWLHELEQDAPFVLTGVGYDHIEGRFTGRIADPYAMARRLYSFCPDIVDQGTGSVAALALELRRLNAFSCWWD